jgi:alpha-glucoside transport system substrate-binding protein
MRRRKFIQQVAVAAAVAIVTTSCLSEPGSSTAGGGGTPSGDKEVEIAYAFGGDRSRGFQESFQEFTQRTGIAIRFSEASQSFNTLVQTRVQGGNLPDIALFPQPGILLDLADQGRIADLSTVLDLPALEKTLVPGELAAATAEDGTVYGAPVVMNVKSLVFYPKQAWEAAGYPVPQTQDELLTLTQRMVSEGRTPWCVGLGAESATGWPATDWIEDYVLRIGGPDVYDRWYKHEIPFNDPVVVQAADAFEQMALAEGHVLGGRASVASNNFSTAANPMFDNPPGCFMHRQADFITQEGFFPDSVRADMDNLVGVFQFPGETPDDRPVLGGGDIAAAFNGEDPDTKAVMEFMTSPEYKGWVEQGGFISPHTTYDLANYRDEITRQIAQIGYGASVFRFDASDLMPGAVGSGSFWREMTAWVSDQTDLETALDDIEATWPAGS